MEVTQTETPPPRAIDNFERLADPDLQRAMRRYFMRISPSDVARMHLYIPADYATLVYNAELLVEEGFIQRYKEDRMNPPNYGSIDALVYRTYEIPHPSFRDMFQAVIDLFKK